MTDLLGRIRVVSDDGLAHTTQVLAVSPDGAEVPLAQVVSRVEMSCDADTGMWKAVLWVEQVAVDVAVADVETRDVAVRPATEEC